MSKWRVDVIFALWINKQQEVWKIDSLIKLQEKKTHLHMSTHTRTQRGRSSLTAARFNPLLIYGIWVIVHAATVCWLYDIIYGCWGPGCVWICVCLSIGRGRRLKLVIIKWIYIAQCDGYRKMTPSTFGLVPDEPHFYCVTHAAGLLMKKLRFDL